MIVLTGTLRQSGEMNINEKPLLKLWVEHESPRDKGPADLKIEEFFVSPDQAAFLPTAGQQVSLIVRPYARGRDVAFSCVGVYTGETLAA